VNLTLRGAAARAGLLLGALAAATSLTAPVRPPRVYANGAGSAAAVHVNHTMPSDPPVIRG
jgi:hypothetical protein